MSMKIYILAIISFLVGTSEFVISGILDMLANDVGVSLAAAGQLITVYSLAYAIGTPILIAVTARMDRRKLMLWALSLFFIGNLITVLTSGYAMLLGARIILAISTGVFMVVALTVAAKIAQPGKQGGAIATVLLGFNLALILGVPLGRIIAGSYDWKIIFTGIGLLSLLAMFVLMLTIPKSEGEEPVPIRQQLALLKNPRISIALSIGFFWIFGYMILYTYITPFLLTVTGMSERMVSIGLFAFGLASLLGSQVGGYGVDKWGIPRTMIGGLIFHSGILFLLTALSHSSLFVLPLLMLWSFFAWFTGPVQMGNLISMAPQASGIILSLNNSIVQLGMAVGAVVGGVIVDNMSLTAVGWFGGIGVAIAIIPAIFSLSMRRKSVTQEQQLRVFNKS
ncbi:putative MFS-type transporter YbcL [Paenibacillus radicis (ex Gao et al. 2016)]|uniref:MFS-type transporter YbcL n=1 Tax=Paenibacillus radicis (ex Gao et al. 2016) TaxID=1737354 RepID=A0A917H7W3_9BACL|nr:putative MFS-type transporter YbcL [Paenibacillus radicis (ex Gao et al. 2016)]